MNISIDFVTRLPFKDVPAVLLHVFWPGSIPVQFTVCIIAFSVDRFSSRVTAKYETLVVEVL